MILASAPLALVLLRDRSKDGAFLVVVAVWQLPHFSLAMMSSPGPANAGPLKARAALQAAIVKINFMLVSIRMLRDTWYGQVRGPV